MSDFKKFCIGEKLSPVQIVGARKAWQEQQAKIDELHKISVALNTETIRQREQVAYYLSKNAELQKRVDAAKQLIEDLNKCYQQDHQNKFEYWRGFADSAGILGKRLEQALNGGNE